MEDSACQSGIATAIRELEATPQAMTDTRSPYGGVASGVDARNS